MQQCGGVWTHSAGCFPGFPAFGQGVRCASSHNFPHYLLSCKGALTLLCKGEKQILDKAAAQHMTRHNTMRSLDPGQLLTVQAMPRPFYAVASLPI